MAGKWSTEPIHAIGSTLCYTDEATADFLTNTSGAAGRPIPWNPNIRTFVIQLTPYESPDVRTLVNNIRAILESKGLLNMINQGVQVVENVINIITYGIEGFTLAAGFQKFLRHGGEIHVRLEKGGPPDIRDEINEDEDKSKFKRSLGQLRDIVHALDWPFDHRDVGVNEEGTPATDHSDGSNQALAIGVDRNAADTGEDVAACIVRQKPASATVQPNEERERSGQAMNKVRASAFDEYIPSPSYASSIRLMMSLQVFPFLKLLCEIHDRIYNECIVNQP